MRIAWVGPFAAGSADARYCLLTVEALREIGHDPVVFRTDLLHGAAAQPFSGEIAAAESLLHRDDLDIVFYALNDHFPSYGPVYPLLSQRPGIVVFLSWFLYSYFRGMMADQGASAEAIIGAVEEFYGSGSFVSEEDFLALPINEALRRIDRVHPMGEWVARHALGGIAHSSFYLDKLAAACPGPVAMAPLAYVSAPIAPARSRPSDARHVLLTLGVMNANKRVETVIRTLGSTPTLRERCVYRCVGAITDMQRQEWLALAASLDVDISFTGYVDEAAMRRHLADADIISCLRDPPLEGGSGSVIEAMLSGRPVIVTRTGCYLDIPDTLALKVDPEREQETLARHLLDLLAEPERGAAMGEQAQAWARRTHAPRGYAQALVRLAEAVAGGG